MSALLVTCSSTRFGCAVCITCAGLVVRSIMQAAKYLFRQESTTRPDEGEKACECSLALSQQGLTVIPCMMSNSCFKGGSLTSPSTSRIWD